MKKIKISELPLCSTLKGLFTLGTDADNRSVKVSLEFVENETTAAVGKANTAAENADTATKNAKTATTNAENATTDAKNATKAANDAAGLANTAAGNADKATEAANDAAKAANDAAGAVKEQTAACKTATDASVSQTEKAVEATSNANAATSNVLLTLGRLVPTAMQASVLQSITLGNLQPIYVDVELSPETAMKNVIYLSDNMAVQVTPQGLVRPVAVGRSFIHVIPTCNTALAKTLEVVVHEATLRKVSKTVLRFTSAGALRMN